MKSKKSSGKPAGKGRSKTRKVRDLSVKSVAMAGVKGGTLKAAKGTHFPEVVLDSGPAGPRLGGSGYSQGDMAQDLK